MSNALVGRPMEILLIEDNRDDARLTREALRDSKIQHRLTIVCDGCEAMKFLHREDWFARAPTPDMILLDLNLPRKDGREILGEIKADYEIKDVPVVILTASRDEQDQVRGDLFHVEGYLTKPVDMQRFVSLVKELRAYWHQDVILPASIWEH
ncbi:MAG: response regulator [Planctomycetota bacterium]|nr:response regulator [Planctomycetota bacterium]